MEEGWVIPTLLILSGNLLAAQNHYARLHTI